MATIISNQATATYTFDGTSELRNASSNIASTTLLDSYNLEVTSESLQENFTPNENITYLLNIKNTGILPLTKFIISENTEQLTTFIPNSARLITGANVLTIVPTQTSPLTFEIPNVLNTNDSFILIYSNKVSDKNINNLMQIENLTTVSALSGFDSSDTKRYIETCSHTLKRYTEANLVINKSVSKSSIYSNDCYDYILNITNNGLIEAKNVVIQDYLPQGFSVNSISFINNEENLIFNPNEYNISEDNVLTLPSNIETKINIKATELGKDNSTKIVISGNYVTPQL